MLKELVYRGILYGCEHDIYDPQLDREADRKDPDYEAKKQRYNKLHTLGFDMLENDFKEALEVKSNKNIQDLRTAWTYAYSSWGHLDQYYDINDNQKTKIAKCVYSILADFKLYKKWHWE